MFVFYTPWGLYKYNTLVMGVSSASSECHERIRLVVEGLEGVQQIKDDIVVHGDGKEHDSRLEALEWDLYMGTSGKWSTTTVNLVPYKYILLLSIPVSTPGLSPSTFPYCSSASVLAINTTLCQISILSKPQPQLNLTSRLS